MSDDVAAAMGAAGKALWEVEKLKNELAELRTLHDREVQGALDLRAQLREMENLKDDLTMAVTMALEALELCALPDRDDHVIATRAIREIEEMAQLTPAPDPDTLRTQEEGQ